MSTGNFENWAGNISELSAVYPFVGSEGLLAIVGIIFWLWWHIRQAKIENDNIADELKRFGDKESLLKLIDKENPEDP